MTNRGCLAIHGVCPSTQPFPLIHLIYRGTLLVLFIAGSADSASIPAQAACGEAPRSATPVSAVPLMRRRAKAGIKRVLPRRCRKQRRPVRGRGVAYGVVR